MAYILSNFWAWLGAMCLIICISNGIANVFAAARPVRKVRVSQVNGCVTVEIENATQVDIDTALADISQNRKENNPDD